MRVRIIFILQNKGAKIPFHHQHLLSKFAQQIIAKCDSKYKDYRFFNYSGLKGQIKVGKGGLHYLSNKVTLVLSSLDVDFINQFLNSLFQFKDIQIGDMELQPESIEMEEAVTFENKTKYVCISPILVLDPILHAEDNKNFYEPNSDEFSDFLYESTMIRLERSGMFTAEQIASFNQFQLIPDFDYITRMKKEDKKYARIYPSNINNDKYEVRGYTFPFTLYAAPEVHNFIFNSGIGALCENGFGMVDLANSNPTNRTIKYGFENGVMVQKTDPVVA